MIDPNPFHDPQFCAFVAVIVCVIALVAWKFIDDWDRMRDEARRERNAKKRWWD